MKSKMNVAILIYKNVELVDMNGPLDAFLHANSYNGGRYQVYTVASKPGPIVSEGDVVTIMPQFTIANCPVPDIVVIPGIMNDDYTPGVADAVAIEWLKKLGKAKKIIMSVCIGSFTLAKTGLLSGKKATTHYLSVDDFHKQYPDINIVKNVRYVEDGNLVSTGGITSGIDGALYLVGKIDGPDIAQQTADVMVYNRDNPLPPYTILPPYYS